MEISICFTFQSCHLVFVMDILCQWPNPNISFQCTLCILFFHDHLDAIGQWRVRLVANLAQKMCIAESHANIRNWTCKCKYDHPHHLSKFVGAQHWDRFIPIPFVSANPNATTHHRELLLNHQFLPNLHTWRACDNEPSHHIQCGAMFHRCCCGCFHFCFFRHCYCGIFLPLFLHSLCHHRLSCCCYLLMLLPWWHCHCHCEQLEEKMFTLAGCFLMCHFF